MAAIDEAELRNAEAAHPWLASRLDLGSPVCDPGPRRDAHPVPPVCGKWPDEVLEDCLQPGRDRDVNVLRTRARREYIENVGRFEVETGSCVQASLVRSFLIHHGLAMNPSITA